MKKRVLLAISLLATVASANTTMCFKENHKSLSTIETVALDGGECAGKHSVNDMKKMGYIVSDIKINGNNYIYIFKKEQQNSNSNQNIAQMDLDAISASVLAKQKEKEELKKEQEAKIRVEDAKTIYISKCQNCHGEKGESYIGGSRLNKLSEDDMLAGYKEYVHGVGNKSSSVYSSFHINNLNDKTVKDIKKYLDSIN